MTFVYAKCRDTLRRPLWNNLVQLSPLTQPRCTIRDFNVITKVYEKLGGIPYDIRKIFEFMGVIEACGLIDLGFYGSKFTWSNLRGAQFRIWKRLYRAMVFDAWLKDIPLSTITHLSSVGSDHCPLLLEMQERVDSYVKYFKFLDCWVEHPIFINTVENCWQKPCAGIPMWRFQ